jgi:oligopeptide transport system substrate-binding protein
MKTWNYFMCASAATLLLASCQKHAESVSKKVLKLNFSKIPPTLDPRKGGDPVSSTFQFMLFEGLTAMTPESTSSLALADDVKISEDYKTYVFHIKEAYWSNGARVLASDFEKSWKDMLSPNFPCPNSPLLYPIKNAALAKAGLVPLDLVGVYAADDSTLKVELENPTPYFLELTSFCALFPVYHQETDQPLEFSNKDIITNGAFRLSKYQPGYEMVLEKNPTFYKADEVNLDQITVSFVTDEATAFHLFENKEIDILGGFYCDIPIDVVHDLQKHNAIETVAIGSTTFCAFNMDKFPFTNRNIRKAFCLAMNRHEIVSHILQAGETIAQGCIPPFMKNMVSKPAQENTHLAKQYFDKGLEDLKLSSATFPKITLTLANSAIRSRVALALQEQLQNVLSINIQLEPLDLKVYLDKINSKNHQFALCTSVIQYNDISNILERFKYKNNPKNFSSWEDPKFISYLDQSSNTGEFDERLRFFEAAEKQMIEEAPISPLYHSNLTYIKQKEIKGFYVSPIGSMHVNYISIGD